MSEKKSPAKQLQPEAEKKKPIFIDSNNEVEAIPPVAFKPERSYTIEQVSNAIDAYYAKRESKTPAMVDLYDLKLEVAKSLKLL